MIEAIPLDGELDFGVKCASPNMPNASLNNEDESEVNQALIDKLNIQEDVEMYRQLHDLMTITMIFGVSTLQIKMI